MPHWLRFVRIGLRWLACEVFAFGVVLLPPPHELWHDGAHRLVLPKSRLGSYPGVNSKQ